MPITPAGLAWVAGVVILIDLAAVGGLFISSKIPVSPTHLQNTLVTMIVEGMFIYAASLLVRLTGNWYTRVAVRRIRNRGG